MGKIADYIKCQKFIVKSELDYHWTSMKLNVSQSEFLDRTIESIFDSLLKIAAELDKEREELDKKRQNN